MTCKDFLTALDKDPRDCTTAELAVYARHFRKCLECRNTVRKRASQADLTTSKESAERSRKIGEEAAVRCLKDPEALEVIYGD